MPGPGRRPTVRGMRRLLVALAVLAALPLTGRAEAQPAPPPETAPLTGVRDVTTGVDHSCALLHSGQVRCWGSSNYGMLGAGDYDPSPTPRTVVAVTGSGPLTGVTQVAAGRNHTCALLGSGQVRCWGFNGDGQLGNNGSYDSFNRPQVVLNQAGTAPLTGVTAIDVGGETSCALLASRQVRCWGSNSSGQAGSGLATTSVTPRKVVSPAGTGPLTGVTQISVGLFTTCARLNTGQARCWGYNDRGQVGDGTTGPDRRRPRVVRAVSGPGPLTDVAQVSAGASVSCAVLTNGQVRCWGQGDDGGLATGQLTDRNRPVRAKRSPGAALTGVRRVEAADSGACALLTNSQVRCWGNGLRGQLGNGDLVEDNPFPMSVEAPAGTSALTGSTRLAFADAHACVRLANRQVRCWGKGISGQLGDGNSVDSAVVVTVAS